MEIDETDVQPPPTPPLPQLPPHSVDLLYLPAKYGGIGVRSPYVAATASFVLPVARSIRLAINGITQPSTNNTIHLPASHRTILLKYKTSDSRLFRLFRQYGVDILRHRFPDDPTAHLITTFTTSTLNLRGFQRDFHRKYYSKQQHSLYINEHTATNAPSLTSPWMSLALHSLSRQHKDHRLDSTTYRLSLLRRLRLPILPPALIGTKCVCGTPLDPYGDHLFSCKSHHKGKLHNAIRDTLAALLRVLAPIAAFTDSGDSVTIETPQLLPNDLRKRPADVGMHLLASYLQIQAPQLARFLAIDVTIPPPPPSSGASPTAATATTQHHKKERAKFEISGARTSVQVFEDLISEQILLLPFTVDHLGGIGTLAYRLLFGTDENKAPTPTTTPPPNRNSLLLYNMAYGKHAPTDLLRRADENWTNLHPYTRFGASYHTTLPSHWAQQFLGLNLTNLLSNHIHRALQKIQTHHHSRSRHTPHRNSYQPVGRTFRSISYTSRVRTIRLAHDL